jgi:cysteine synthase
MVEAAERDGDLTPRSILVESLSGNLGVALYMIAASKGYRFLCVTDLRCSLSTRLLMEALATWCTSSGMLAKRTTLASASVVTGTRRAHIQEPAFLSHVTNCNFCYKELT